MSWKKLINSGSKAHVESLELSTPDPDQISLQTEGTVLFSNLIEQPSPNNLAPGRLMKSITSIDDGSTSKYVLIKSNVDPIYPDSLIPWNYGNVDQNGDGQVSTADLLQFLTLFGTTDAPLWGGMDFNFDGSVTTQDLLIFLGLFGTFSDSWGDTRPTINWCDLSGWIDDDNNVTVASVNAYYNIITLNGANPNAFWDAVASVNDSPDQTVYNSPQIFPGNVYDYISLMEFEGQPIIPTIYLFTYIYFEQHTDGPHGGSNVYTTTAYPC